MCPFFFCFLAFSRSSWRRCFSTLCAYAAHFFSAMCYINFCEYPDLLVCLMPDQDSVRLLAVEGCAALGKLLEPQDCIAHILPVIVNFSQVGMLFVL